MTIFFPHPDELSDPVEVVPSLGVYKAVHIEAGDAEKEEGRGRGGGRRRPGQGRPDRPMSSVSLSTGHDMTHNGVAKHTLHRKGPQSEFIGFIVPTWHLPPGVAAKVLASAPLRRAVTAAALPPRWRTTGPPLQGPGPETPGLGLYFLFLLFLLFSFSDKSLFPLLPFLWRHRRTRRKRVGIHHSPGRRTSRSLVDMKIYYIIVHCFSYFSLCSGSAN